MTLNGQFSAVLLLLWLLLPSWPNLIVGIQFKFNLISKRPKELN